MDTSNDFYFLSCEKAHDNKEFCLEILKLHGES